MGRVISRNEAKKVVAEARGDGKTVVFTNGCFDLIHRGHVDLLGLASSLGDLLVVGMNTDDSVRRLKGSSRPWMPQDDRAAVMAALAAVDLVVLFEEDTPLELIGEIEPDVLVKGADYREEEVVGADLVRASGGRVELVPLTEGRSTTTLVEKLKSSLPGFRE
jgi:D-beta-D-heptose 7-phosphate kinase/D-beta-D-heptose 1-phosphate adenosyltransferase